MARKKLHTDNQISAIKLVPNSAPIQIVKLPISESIKKLKAADIDVTDEEAEEIMNFLYMFAQVVLKEFVSKRDLL